MLTKSPPAQSVPRFSSEYRACFSDRSTSDNSEIRSSGFPAIFSRQLLIHARSDVHVLRHFNLAHSLARPISPHAGPSSSVPDESAARPRYPANIQTSPQSFQSRKLVSHPASHESDTATPRTSTPNRAIEQLTIRPRPGACPRDSRGRVGDSSRILSVRHGRDSMGAPASCRPRSGSAHQPAACDTGTPANCVH